MMAKNPTSATTATNWRPFQIEYAHMPAVNTKPQGSLSNENAWIARILRILRNPSSLGKLPHLAVAAGLSVVFASVTLSVTVLIVGPDRRRGKGKAREEKAVGGAHPAAAAHARAPVASCIAPSSGPSVAGRFAVGFRSLRPRVSARGFLLLPAYLCPLLSSCALRRARCVSGASRLEQAFSSASAAAKRQCLASRVCPAAGGRRAARMTLHAHRAAGPAAQPVTCAT